jgi:hypothetical protein
MYLSALPSGDTILPNAFYRYLCRGRCALGQHFAENGCYHER